MTPVRVGGAKVAGRNMLVGPVCGCVGRGVVLTWGVRAQSVRGTPVSLLRTGTTGAAGLGGAGRKDGGLLDGLVVT